MNGVPTDVPADSAAAPTSPPPERSLVVDLLAAGLLGLEGALATLSGAVALVTGGGQGRGWAPAFLVLGLLSVLCARRLLLGTPPMWHVFVQANLLGIALDTLDRKLLATSHRLPWLAWVVMFVAWGTARLVTLHLRRRAAAGVTPSRSQGPTAGDPARAD